MQRNWKRSLALLLALVLCVSLLPAAYAEDVESDTEPDEDQGQIQSISETGEEPEEWAGTFPEEEGTICPVPEEEAGTLVPAADEIQAASASGTCGENLTWTLDENGTLTISGTGEMQDFDWPSMPWGQSQVLSVIIEPGVTSIGSYAFYYCSGMTSIVIPEGVLKIGDDAFLGCSSLTSLRLPASVSTLGWSLFSNCSSLLAFEVAEDSQYYCAKDGLLFSKDMTRLLYCPNGYTGAYTVPDTVTQIDSHTFYGCHGLTEVTIPASVTQIGSWAFLDCGSLQSITVAAENPSFCAVDGVLYTKDLATLRRCPAAKAGVFYVEPGTKTIDFQSCLHCTELTEVVLPDGVTLIDIEAFCDCTGMTRITIPASLREIDARGLRCPNLTEVVYGGTMAQWREITIRGNSILRQIPIRCTDGVLDDSEKCGNDLTWSFDDASGTLRISGTGDMWDFDWGERPWYNLSSRIQHLEIAPGVRTIGEYAFASCGNLNVIDLPEGVETIGMDAFMQCSLTSVSLPDSLVEIGGGAFSNCRVLQSLVIPANVNRIQWNAFAWCTQLSKVVFLGAAPSYIGSSAFQGVTATISYPGEDDAWAAYVGQNYDGNLSWVPYYGGFRILSQPQSVTVREGEQARFSVRANGENLSYRWYYRTAPSADWTAVKTNGTSAEYILTTALRHNGYQYRCRVTNGTDTVYSTVASLTVLDKNTVAAGSCGQNLSWVLKTDGVLTVSGTGDMTDFVWEGDSSNAPWVPYQSQISTLILEEGVTSVGHEAFDPCASLTSVQLPASLRRIGEFAFDGCGFTELVLPSGLTELQMGAFCQCSALTTVSIPGGLTEIPSYCFYECDALQEVRFGGTREQLKALTINAYNAPLYQGSIFCTDGAVDMASLCGWDLTWSFEESTGTLTISGSGVTWQDYFPWNGLRESIRRLVVKKGVTQLGSQVMNSGAFQDCVNLTQVSLPEGLTFLGVRSFQNCDSLKEVTIPASMTELGQGAFGDCDKLERILVASGSETFSSVDGVLFSKDLKTLYVCPGAMTGSYTVPDCVTAFGWRPFWGCRKLTAIHIPDTVADLGNNTFQFCTSLKEVNIPRSAKSLPISCFYSCWALEEIVVPANITSLYGYTFCDCPSLKRVLFEGNAPSVEITNDIFQDASPTVYYSTDRTGWTEYNRSVLSRNAQWVPCTGGIAILTEPGSVSVKAGEKASFQVEAFGANLQYQWYYQKPGASNWTAVSSAAGKKETYVLTAAERHDGYQYKCRITGEVGSAETGIAELTVLSIPQITAQPESMTVTAGQTANFRVEASGGSLNYKWYYRTGETASWQTVRKNGTSAVCSVAAEERHNGYQYRCKVENSLGSVWTEPVTLTVKPAMTTPTITSQPKDLTVEVGETASFAITAEGGDLRYQWYFRTSAAGAWKTISAASGKTASYSLTTAARHNGYQYQCIVTNDLGSVVSEVVTLNLSGTAPVIVAQPRDVSVTVGNKAVFTVKAAGTDLKYQWYYRMSSAGSWKAISAASGKTASYSLTTAERHNGYQYRCVVTNAQGSATSSIVTLSLGGVAPVIVTQPKSASVEVGSTAKFTVKAAGSDLKYQWYFRTSATGTWKTVSAASGKTASYSLTAAERHNGYQYRCVVTNEWGSVTSGIVALTVNS